MKTKRKSKVKARKVKKALEWIERNRAPSGVVWSPMATTKTLEV